MGNQRPYSGRRPADPFDFLDPKFWSQLESRFTSGIEKAFRSISLTKEEKITKEATETSAAEKSEYLVATLEIPGVHKKDVSVEFTELDYGFTRLSVETERNGVKELFKVEFRETVLAEQANASVELGVLTVRVPVKTDDVRTKFEVPIS